MFTRGYICTLQGSFEGTDIRHAAGQLEGWYRRIRLGPQKDGPKRMRMGKMTLNELAASKNDPKMSI